MPYTAVENAAIEAWQQAAARFGFEVQAPYTFCHLERRFEVLCLLPNFGARSGMLVASALPPSFDIDPLLSKSALEAGLYCSFINPEQYSRFDEGIFLEALNDWGYQIKAAGGNRGEK